MKNLKLKSDNFTNEIEKVIATLKEPKVPSKRGKKAKLTENIVQRQAQQTKPQAVEPTKAYRDTYLQKNDNIKARHCAYVSEENYAYCAEVVRVVTHNNIPVGSYIDNIINEHRASNNGTIKEMFKQEYEKGLQRG